MRYSTWSTVCVIDPSRRRRGDPPTQVKPADPSKITRDDLDKSKQAHTVVSMLVDVHGFLAYDNREHLMAGEGEDDLTVFGDDAAPDPVEGAAEG